MFLANQFYNKKGGISSFNNLYRKTRVVEVLTEKLFTKPKKQGVEIFENNKNIKNRWNVIRQRATK